MGTKHKHYDVIVAWAAGEEIEYWSDSSEKWYPCVGDVIFRDHFQYRIKPKRVKKEGWVNVFDGPWFIVHTSKDIADMDNMATRKKLACIRITWEEEQ
jgi:hypothetical protein